MDQLTWADVLKLVVLLGVGAGAGMGGMRAWNRRNGNGVCRFDPDAIVKAIRDLQRSLAEQQRAIREIEISTRVQEELEKRRGTGSPAASP